MKRIVVVSSADSCRTSFASPSASRPGSSAHFSVQRYGGMLPEQAEIEARIRKIPAHGRRQDEEEVKA